MTAKSPLPAPHSPVQRREGGETLIYLASPYGHTKPLELRQARYEAAVEAEAAMMNAGLMVYSPIVHRHPGALRGLYPHDWEYWRRFDELILSRCDEVHVLTLPGWRESIGVTAEIEIAERMRKAVRYIEPRDWQS